MAKQSNPLPIQATPFSEKHFSTPEGIHFFNLWASQVVNAINAGSGQAGPVVIPAGVDVAGGKVSGLGAATQPTDAVSLGHSNASYGPQAVSPQLDIGGQHTLKGLAYAFNQSVANSQSITSLQNSLPTSYAGGESMTLFGWIVKCGHTATFSGTQAVTFATQFPTACKVALAVDDNASSTQRQMSVNSASVTATGFTIQSSGAGNGAWWIAVGY